MIRAFAIAYALLASARDWLLVFGLGVALTALLGWALWLNFWRLRYR